MDSPPMNIGKILNLNISYTDLEEQIFNVWLLWHEKRDLHGDDV
jgi:hypothetical protein